MSTGRRWLACIVALSIGSGLAPAAEQETSSTLPVVADGGSVHVPATLEELVRMMPAAVIAQVKAFGPVMLRERRGTRNQRQGLEAFAQYSVTVQSVLYNAAGTAAPQLKEGTAVQLTQLMGRSEAESFDRGVRKIAPGDECVFFLWHRSGAPEWSIDSWPIQLCRARDNTSTATTVVPVEMSKWPITVGGQPRQDGRVDVSWDGIVADIRTTAAAQGRVK